MEQPTDRQTVMIQVSYNEAPDPSSVGCLLWSSEFRQKMQNGRTDVWSLWRTYYRQWTLPHRDALSHDKNQILCRCVILSNPMPSWSNISWRLGGLSSATQYNLLHLNYTSHSTQGWFYSLFSFMVCLSRGYELRSNLNKIRPFSTMTQGKKALENGVSYVHVSVATMWRLRPCGSCVHVEVVSMCQICPCVSCVHVSVASMCQLHPCDSFVHLSIAFRCQLRPCVSCIHVSVASMFQLHPCVNCAYLSFVSMCQLRPCVKCVH